MKVTCKGVLFTLLAVLLLLALAGYLFLRSVGLFREPVYDTLPPAIPPLSSPAILDGDLRRFDVVVWNNTYGDILTTDKRAAFKSWFESGGQWLGIHAAGGDFAYAFLLLPMPLQSLPSKR